MKKPILLFFTMLFSLHLSARTVPNDLAQELSSIPLNKNNYSIHIEAVNSSYPLVSWKSHTKRSPASIIKLLTTYSSLLALGYDYSWETKFYHTGRIQNGVLRGNLIVKASGDPTLKNEDLDRIVSQIKNAGIRRIIGNIVIDRTLFKVSTKNNSGFDKNRYSPYNAMPDAMMFNQRRSTVCVSLRGRKAKISKDVPDRSYKVINKLKVVNGSCRGKRAWPRVSINKSTLTFSGTLSRHCGKRTVCKVLTKPYLSFYYALRDKMKQRGVNVTGKLKLQKTPKNAQHIFSHYSESLEEVISVVSKKSNNLYARQLMLTLGAKIYGEPGTPYNGRRAIERVLGRYNLLEKGTTYIDNGSGLSRTSKITAQSLANLLKHGAENYGQRWMNTLSIAGIDGTIKRRFANSNVFGRAWMKTGTIKGVANIAGYVEGVSGQIYVVVVIVNDKFSVKYGRKLANRVIEWVSNTQ